MTTLAVIARKDGHGLVDGPFGSNLPASEYVPLGIPVIRGTNLSLGDIRFKDHEFVFVCEGTAKRLERSLCHSEDIIFTKKGTLGQIGIIPQSHRYNKFLLSSNQMKLSVDQEVAVPLFVYYYLASPASREKIIRDSEATGVPKTNLTYLKTFPIVLPSLPEQKAIAHILGTLDDKIELNREMNQTLEAMARAIFKSWFVDFDPVRAKMEGRLPAGMNAATAELFPDEFEESALGMIPKGWRIDSFDKIVHILSGGTPKTSVSEYWNGNILWFSVKDAPNKSDVFVIDTEKRITQLGVDKSATQILPKGTTIITARGTVGKLALVGVEMAMNQSCFGIKGKYGYTDLFIYYHLSSVITELQHKTHGSVFDTINRQTFTSVKAVLPSKEIAQAFDNVVNPLMDKLLINLFECCTLASIRDTLLPKLLSGEIRVKEAEKVLEALK